MFKIIMALPEPPWRSGGVQRVINEIAKRLRKDFDIAIYCVGKKRGVFSQNGLSIHVFKGYFTDYSFSQSLYKDLRKTKCDLIHCNDFQSFIPLATSLVKKDRKLVFSPYFHPIGSRLIYTLLRKIYDPLIGYCIFRASDLVVCFSETEKLFLSSRFGLPSGKIRVIYNGVNITEIRQAKSYDLRRKIILYAGRLEKYKNVQIIIESLQYLAEEYQLYIIGGGSYADSLKITVDKLDLKDRVKFLGYLTDKEMYRWLRTCSVLVQLSEIESGMSIACIEALAAGKPVIVNDSVTGLKETARLFRDKGVFSFKAQKSSADELARLIENINPVRVNVDLSDFDWDTAARRFRDLYLEILDR